MSTKFLAVLLLLMIMSGGVVAQNIEPQISQIRQLSVTTNQRIAAGQTDKTSGLHYASWMVGGERDGQQWAGVGTLKTTAEFWFDGEPNTDSDAHPDQRRRIRKIVSEYAGAADLRTRAEYLFAEADGLVFAFTTELDPEGKTLERRFYYQKGKLIRVVREGKNIDRNIGTEDKQLATNALTEAKRLQNIFALIFAEE